jgi:hypothetical protein
LSSAMSATAFNNVMAGLVPAIYVFGLLRT